MWWNRNKDRASDNLQKLNGKQFVFIHINKTGGISMGEALNLPKKMHYTAKEVIEDIGLKKWQKAFTFTVVRNPFDKVVSHYRYRVLTNQTDLGTNTIPFKEWVDKTYGKNQDSFYYDQPKMFQTQLDWLSYHDQEVAVDYVMKFENLNADFEKISEYFDLNKPLPHRNKSQRKPFKEYYDQETWHTVKKWFQKDIDYFDYPPIL